jgi:hypothetical protein
MSETVPHPFSLETPEAHWQAAQRFCVERFPDLVLALTEDDGTGWCLECSEQSDDYVEPDARRYRCLHCNGSSVYGASEIMFMGA